MIIWPAKPPAAVAVYAFDFAPFLGEGEAIQGTPAIAAEGVTAGAPVVDVAEVQVELSGGTAGTVAKVTVTIATNQGQSWPETAVIEIGGEAVSLAAAKQAQRIESTEEDAVLAGFLRAAVRKVETATSKNLTQQIETQVLNGFPATRGSEAIRLWKGPVSDIVSVKYDDGDGVEQTLSSFRLVEGKNAKLLPAYGESWPVTGPGAGSVRIQYVAGFDPADRDLFELRQAAILLFGHFNANREAVVAGASAAAAELPLGVAALLEPYRVPGIA